MHMCVIHSKLKLNYLLIIDRHLHIINKIKCKHLMHTYTFFMDVLINFKRTKRMYINISVYVTNFDLYKLMTSSVVQSTYLIYI